MRGKKASHCYPLVKQKTPTLTEQAPEEIDQAAYVANLLAALALEGEFVICGHGASYAGACPGGGGW